MGTIEQTRLWLGWISLFHKPLSWRVAAVARAARRTALLL